MKKIISLLALALFLAMYVPANAQNDGFFSSSYNFDNEDPEQFRQFRGPDGPSGSGPVNPELSNLFGNAGNSNFTTVEVVPIGNGSIILLISCISFIFIKKREEKA